MILAQRGMHAWLLFVVNRDEYLAAKRGQPPAARKCASVGELADWFALFAVACGAPCPTSSR